VTADLTPPSDPAEPTGVVRDCAHCEGSHGVRFLCDPAAELLKAIREHGARHDMPTVEFDTPIIDPHGDDGAVLVAGLTAKACIVPVLGVARPALLLHPVGVNDRQLTPLLYIGTRDNVDRFAELIRDVADMACRAASKANGGKS
jgi:hypothetical protein